MSACPSWKGLGPGDSEYRILPRPPPSGGCFPHSSPSPPWGLAACVRSGAQGILPGAQAGGGGTFLGLREKACEVGESEEPTVTLLLHDL